MKANHNHKCSNIRDKSTVSYGSKILKWKQITTIEHIRIYANRLFLMVQKYKDEKQITTELYIIPAKIQHFK